MTYDPSLDIALGQDRHSVWAEFGASIRDIGHKVDSLHKAVYARRPFYKTVGGSITMASATGTVIATESPARGRTWNILKVVLTSTDGHTVLPSVVADLYASTAVDPSNPVLSGLIFGGAAVPSVNHWPKEVEWCQSGEQVFGLIYGATAGQVINLSVRVAEYATPVVEGMHT
jgi:hypothetical protein